MPLITLVDSKNSAYRFAFTQIQLADEEPSTNQTMLIGPEHLQRYPRPCKEDNPVEHGCIGCNILTYTLVENYSSRKLQDHF